MAKHILVVDDDTLLRRSLSLQLEQAGYRASTAASAEDALAMVKRDRPDLILLDVGLPGMDGLDALKHFQQDIDVPVIFVTAKSEIYEEKKRLELVAVDYITKPFSPPTVKARVHTHLALYDDENQLASKNAQLQQEVKDRKHAEQKAKQAQVIAVLAGTAERR